MKVNGHTPETFDKLKEYSTSLFRSFLPEQYSEEFEQLLDKFDKEYQELLRKETEKVNRQFAEIIYENCKNKSCIERVHGKGILSKFVNGNDASHDHQDIPKDYTKETKNCSTDCRDVNYIIKSIGKINKSETDVSDLQLQLKLVSPDSLQNRIHDDSVLKLYEKIKPLWDKHLKEKTTTVIKALDANRKHFIAELLKWLNQRVEKTTVKPLFDISVTFYEINPIINTEANATDFKLSRKSFETKIHEIGSSAFVSLSQVIFLSEKIGYLNLANFPPEKSTLYYFNFNNSPSAQFIGQHLSPYTKLIIDERSNIFFIYDNSSQLVQRGKLDERTRRLQATIPVDNLYNNAIEDLVDEEGKPKLLACIEMACFLYGSDIILILDDQFNLVEYRHMIGTLKLVCRRINEDTHIRKAKLSPNDDSTQKYVCIDVIPTGKCVLLQCLTSVDIYDLTWTKTGSIPIDDLSNFVGFKCFADEMNACVALINKQSAATVYLFRGLSATRTVDVQQTKAEQPKGFPLLDIFYLTQRKFGLPSEYIGCPRKTQISFILPEKFPVTSDQLDTYFTQL